MAWTSPFTWTFKYVPTFAFLNTEIRDRFNLLATSIDTSTGRLSGELKTFREEITTVAFSATPTFDLSLSNNFKLTLTGNVTAITVSNWTASKAATVVIRLTQDGTGGRTVVLPAGWKWAGGGAPTITPTLNKTDILVLYSDDGGTTIFASMLTANA